MASKIGINRKGEKIRIDYFSQADLEYTSCLNHIVKFEEPEKKPVESPQNRAVDDKKLVKR